MLKKSVQNNLECWLASHTGTKRPKAISDKKEIAQHALDWISGGKITFEAEVYSKWPKI